MAAVMLAPGELAFQQACVEGGHLGDAVVVGVADVPGTEEPEDRAGGDGRHVAALLIELGGVPFFGDAVADERGARGAERDQFVGIDRQIVGGLRAEARFRRAILQKVAGHPVVFT